ncbi:hypothetical protein ACTFIZ_010608 [Dictyostelium cf. discoideum]
MNFIQKISKPRYNFIFLFLILILNNFSNLKVNSQTLLNKNEYDCLKSLLTNLGSINKVKINTTSLEYLFCDTLEFSSPYIEIVCNEGSVSRLGVGQANLTYTVTDDFSCFKNMTQLSVNNIVYDKDIFYNSYPPNAKEFSFDGTNLVYGSISPIIKTFKSSPVQTIPTIIKFSWYLNTTKIDFLVSFDNDLDGSKNWACSITIISLNVPSLNFITGDITLDLKENYDQSSWRNITSFGGMTYMTLRASDLTSFPIEFSNLRSEVLTSIFIETRQAKMNV